MYRRQDSKNFNNSFTEYKYFNPNNPKIKK